MKNISLLILAAFLFSVLAPIGVLYGLVLSKNRIQWARDIAEGIDQLGNVVLQYAFNKWLISDGGYRFGDKDETVSSALGKNKRMDKLTPPGKWLDSILDMLDKNHTIDAIEETP